MTKFVALAAVLAAIALAFVLPPLLRRRATAPDARVAANADIYREQLEELGAELQRGAITKEEFERASREVERRIVAEHGAAAPAAAQSRAPRLAVLAVAILVPLGAGVGYWMSGDLRGLDPAAHMSPEQHMERLAAQLVDKLQQKPDDAEGWTLLGRALMSLGRPADAAQALARAVQLQPDNRELLVEFIKSLAIAGRAEFEQQKYADAVAYWERILPFAPPQSDFYRTVAESIDEARKLAGASAASVRGVVRLDPALKSLVNPGDTVFVLARAADARGAGMPLAVARTTVDKLPYTFTLDDSMAMTPNSKLSGQSSVVVTARISRSGNAGRQKGDIEGSSAPVKPGATGVHVVLSKTVD
jgi:cytochrome c-type biogenesis protein CcmH